MFFEIDCMVCIDLDVRTEVVEAVHLVDTILTVMWVSWRLVAV